MVNRLVADMVNGYGLAATASPVSAIEGQAFQGAVATLAVADPAGMSGGFSAAIDWGDGTPSRPDITEGTIVQPAGGGTAKIQVTGGHTYAEAGTYTIKVTVQGPAGGPLETTGQATVTDAPLTDTTKPNTIVVPAAANRSTGNTVLATFTDGNPMAAATDFAVSVDWHGAVPGSTSDAVQLVLTSARSSAWEVVGGATYPGPGSYPLHITVTDEDSSTNTFTDANTTIAINFPVPELASISPDHVGIAYSSPLTLTLVGADFFTQSVVQWTGAALPTTYVSPTMLTASVPSSDFNALGSALITVANPRPGGGTSNNVTFRVLPTAPTSSVSPLPRVGTSLSFPVTVTGTDPDDAGASSPSGIASFTIYDAIDGGPWQPWTTVAPTSTSGATATATATFTGLSSTTYAFYATATDVAGNTQAYRPSIEASIYLPDLIPPVTSIRGGSYNGDGTFTLNLEGTDPGGGILTYFEAWVAIDAQPPVPIGPAIPAGPPDGSGISTATVRYVMPPADYGASHSYVFTTAGIDSAGNAETPHATAGQGRFSAVDTPIASQLAVVGLTVQDGAAERSYIRDLTVDFNDAEGPVLQSIVDSVNAPTASNPAELSLVRYSLTGGGPPVPVSLQGLLSVVDNAIEIDFGPGGLGGSPNTSTADGYYALSFAPVRQPGSRGSARRIISTACWAT